ncbi:MAG: restriction endonuclease [Dechloromonas sp.]|nr:restriction endonuclease [Dechloromonas sp.]
MRSSLVDVIGLTTSLPWQLWGLLALVAYWGLHDLSVWAGMDGGGGSGLGRVLQFVIPGLLLLVVLRSFFRARQQDEQPVDQVSDSPLDALAHLSVRGIEKLVAEAFRREGYLVVERKKSSHPASVDLELFMGRDRYLVQCRRWREPTIDVRAVRELYAVISAERAVGGFVVTSGKFTDEARKMALGRSIRVVPAESLRRLLGSVSAPLGVGEPTISPMFSRRRHDPAPPACPTCGKAMMPRTKREDSTMVQVGWGCTSFPACQGSRGL